MVDTLFFIATTLIALLIFYFGRRENSSLYIIITGIILIILGSLVYQYGIGTTITTLTNATTTNSSGLVDFTVNITEIETNPIINELVNGLATLYILLGLYIVLTEGISTLSGYRRDD